MPLTIELLNNSHIKGEFDCGYDMLNTYLTRQASQDVKRDLSACYVLADENKKATGYYTLSSNSIRRDEFPEELVRKLPQSNTDLRTALLGRLVISKEYGGKGYGEYTLIDALNRCVAIAERLGTLAVVVDLIDKKAEGFYSKYGFIKLHENAKMFIPIKTIKQAWPEGR